MAVGRCGCGGGFRILVWGVLGLCCCVLWECVAGCAGGCWRGWTAGWVLVICFFLSFLMCFTLWGRN